MSVSAAVAALQNNTNSAPSMQRNSSSSSSNNGGISFQQQQQQQNGASDANRPPVCSAKGTAAATRCQCTEYRPHQWIATKCRDCTHRRADHAGVATAIPGVDQPLRAMNGGVSAEQLAAPPSQSVNRPSAAMQPPVSAQRAGSLSRGESSNINHSNAAASSSNAANAVATAAAAAALRSGQHSPNSNFRAPSMMLQSPSLLAHNSHTNINNALSLAMMQPRSPSQQAQQQQLQPRGTVLYTSTSAHHAHTTSGDSQSGTMPTLALNDSPHNQSPRSLSTVQMRAAPASSNNSLASSTGQQRLGTMGGSVMSSHAALPLSHHGPQQRAPTLSHALSSASAASSSSRLATHRSNASSSDLTITDPSLDEVLASVKRDSKQPNTSSLLGQQQQHVLQSPSFSGATASSSSQQHTPKLSVAVPRSPQQHPRHVSNGGGSGDFLDLAPTPHSGSGGGSHSSGPPPPGISRAEHKALHQRYEIEYRSRQAADAKLSSAQQELADERAAHRRALDTMSDLKLELRQTQQQLQVLVAKYELQQQQLNTVQQQATERIAQMMSEHEEASDAAEALVQQRLATALQQASNANASQQHETHAQALSQLRQQLTVKAQQKSDEQTARQVTHLQQLTMQHSSAMQRLQDEMTEERESMQHRSEQQREDHARQMSLLQTKLHDVEHRLTKSEADKNFALANAAQSQSQTRDAAEAELQEQRRLDAVHASYAASEQALRAELKQALDAALTSQRLSSTDTLQVEQRSHQALRHSFDQVQTDIKMTATRHAAELEKLRSRQSDQQQTIERLETQLRQNAEMQHQQSMEHARLLAQQKAEHDRQTQHDAREHAAALAQHQQQASAAQQQASAAQQQAFAAQQQSTVAQQQARAAQQQQQQQILAAQQQASAAQAAAAKAASALVAMEKEKAAAVAAAATAASAAAAAAAASAANKVAAPAPAPAVPVIALPTRPSAVNAAVAAISTSSSPRNSAPSSNSNSNGSQPSTAVGATRQPVSQRIQELQQNVNQAPNVQFRDSSIAPVQQQQQPQQQQQKSSQSQQQQQNPPPQTQPQTKPAPVAVAKINMPPPPSADHDSNASSSDEDSSAANSSDDDDDSKPRKAVSSSAFEPDESSAPVGGSKSKAASAAAAALKTSAGPSLPPRPLASPRQQNDKSQQPTNKASSVTVAAAATKPPVLRHAASDAAAVQQQPLSSSSLLQLDNDPDVHSEIEEQQRRRRATTAASNQSSPNRESNATAPADDEDDKEGTVKRGPVRSKQAFAGDDSDNSSTAPASPTSQQLRERSGGMSGEAANKSSRNSDASQPASRASTASVSQVNPNAMIQPSSSAVAAKLKAEAADTKTPRIAASHWKQSLDSAFPSLDTEEILLVWQKRYGLSDCQCEYLARDIEEILEGFDNASIRQQLRALEQTVDSLDWYLTSKIGAGGFGAVFEGVRRRDGLVIAVKVIDLEETSDDIMTISREIVALTQGQNCEQLTNYYGSVVLGTKLWIGMQFLDGGSVLDMIKTFTAKNTTMDEKYIAIIVREILLGLAYLQTEGKIHRDIKSANVLLSKAEGSVKLADFGASRELTTTMAKCNTFVGSPYWMAPEVMMAASYDGSADIWSQSQKQQQQRLNASMC